MNAHTNAVLLPMNALKINVQTTVMIAALNLQAKIGDGMSLKLAKLDTPHILIILKAVNTTAAQMDLQQMKLKDAEPISALTGAMTAVVVILGANLKHAKMVTMRLTLVIVNTSAAQMDMIPGSQKDAELMFALTTEMIAALNH